MPAPTRPPGETPRAAGFRQPAEWDRHDAVWLAWPSHTDLWGGALPGVRDAFTRFAEAIADRGPSGAPRGERLNVLVPDDENGRLAATALAGLEAHFFVIPFGDIWLRDTAPVFLTGPGNERAAACFDFNGWGGKYVLPHDADVSEKVAEASGLDRVPLSVGPRGRLRRGGRRGHVPHDAPVPPEPQPQRRDDSGGDRGRPQGRARRFDGPLARRRAPERPHGRAHRHDRPLRRAGRGRLHGALGCDDPNTRVLMQIARDLAKMRDAAGRPLNVTTIPSPGLVTDPDGEVMPASYVNFYVANTTVVVPAYGVPNDEPARAAIARLFPGRRAVSIPARQLLEGGGAFHCISQQVPA
jgi:agmatine deiminase